MSKLRIIAALIVSLICLSLSLTSCVDMGEVADESEFKEIFSNVILLDREGRRDVSIDIFSAFDNDEKGVPKVVNFDDYCYIALEVDSNHTVTVSELAFFAWAEGSGASLSFEIYKSRELPTKIKNLDGSYTYYPDKYGLMPQKDINGNYIDRADERDETVLSSEKLLASSAFRIDTKYDSTHIDFDRSATLSGGEYIVIKVASNCVQDGATSLDTCSFTFNYLLFYFEEVN